MEFLRLVKRRRTLLNEVIYVLLNVSLSVGLLLIIRVTGSLWPAFALVLLSKWRIFAVRPRFWFANLQTNLVSIIVSVGYVILLFVVNNANMGDSQILITQIILAALDAAWLILLKPLSKRINIVAQAGVALFVGTTAIFSLSYSWDSSIVVLLVWLVGYATAKHVLNSYDDEDHILFLSLAWGLVLAEIGWLAHHWTIAYRLPVATNLLLPQASIIIFCFGFLAFKAYDSYFHHQKIRYADILMPLLFTVGIICLILLAFNDVNAGA
jgi:hypothetical protein